MSDADEFGPSTSRPARRMSPLVDRSWLDARVRVGESRIEGCGLFATVAIRAGERVMVLRGRVIDNTALAELAGTKYSSVVLDEDTNLLLEPDDPVNCGNHSCDSNLWMDDAITLSARRDIAPGAELTVDYALQTGPADWEMGPCLCRSERCRGIVRGTDWQITDLQRRYAGHFAPVLQRRIARSHPSS